MVLTKNGGIWAFKNPSFRVNSTFLEAPKNISKPSRPEAKALKSSHPGPQVSQSHRFVDFLRFLLGFPFN